MIKNKNWLINIGFFIEIFSFIFAGGFLFIKSFIWFFILFLIGVINAYVVGRLIEKNAIEKWEYGVINEPNI